MTTVSQSTKRKLSLLQLAEELGNVSKACKIMGYHRDTFYKVRSPRTNGFVERMNRTLLDEHFRIKGRDKWYESAEEIQHDLDAFRDFYNLKRSHQGYRLKGRTPAQALREAIGRKKLPPLIPEEDESASGEAA